MVCRNTWHDAGNTTRQQARTGSKPVVFGNCRSDHRPFALVLAISLAAVRCSTKGYQCQARTGKHIPSGK